MAKGKEKFEFNPDEVESRRKEIAAGTDINVKRMSRHSLADAVKELPNDVKASMNATTDAGAFSNYSLFTPAVELDIACGGSLSPRVELLGNANNGKTLLSYMLCGAAQRTCRRCRTPIITWIDDYSALKDDEKKWSANPMSPEFARETRCLCGANDPMTVLFIDAEDQFDPGWASVWGLKVGNFNQYEGVEMEGSEYAWTGIRISPDAQTVICRPSSSKVLEKVVLPMMDKGAIDLVVIDSIASFAIEEDLEGGERVASRARFLKRFLTLFLSKQLSAANQYGSKINLIATNHFMQGPVANPRMNPNKPSGGLALGYTVDQIIELTSSKINEGISEDGWKQRAVMRDINFKITKARGAVLNQTGGFRAYLDDYSPNDKVTYHAGQTDEADRLLEALKRYDDPEIFCVEKQKSGGVKAYWLLGRPFKKVRDVASFLRRDDIRYMLRFALYADTLPVSARMNLKAQRFAYSPFENDPALKLVTKLEKKIGHNLRQARTAAPEPTAAGSGEETAED